MEVLQNLCSMKKKELDKITRAVYIVKCSNEKHLNLYSCGAAGNQQGKTGTLGARLYSHARKTWPKSTLFRHRAAPFSKRIWALHLVNWTELGVQLAEHAFHYRLSLAFLFVHNSCFLANSDDEVREIATATVFDLKAIEKFGNSKACEDKKLD